MAGLGLVFAAIVAVTSASVILEDFGPGVNPAARSLDRTSKTPCKSDLPRELIPWHNRYEWRNRTAEVLPAECSFVSGGGSNRMLYVGRVREGKNVFPAAIHHYGQMGTETVRYIDGSGEVKIQKETEWLCGRGHVGWLRVNDLTSTNILLNSGVPVGYNAETRQFLYSCLVHSFYLDKYPPSVGTVKNNGCEFEVKGTIVNSKDFAFWHTLELLTYTSLP